MEDLRSFNINNFHTDYKAAVLAAELVEAGFDINRLFIWPSGSSRRNFSKDVLSVEWYAPEGGYKDYLCIKSSREGLYDMLPEGLFHASVPYSSSRTTDDLIDQIKRHKEQEKQARKFFLPLEAEINLFRILIELHENKIDKKNIYNDLVEIFRPGWEIFELLDQQQANIFLHMIPLLHQAKGDLSRLEKLTALLLQMPVSVTAVPCRTAYQDGGSQLGTGLLGVDLIAGSSFYEGDEEVLVQVGPVNPADAMRLFPGERLEQVVRWLVAYFVPADMHVRLDVEIEKESREIVLDESAVLGYTAFI